MTDIPANPAIPQSKSKPPSNRLKPEDIESLRKGIPVSESEDDFSETNSVGLYTPEHKPRGIGGLARSWKQKLRDSAYERRLRATDQRSSGKATIYTAVERTARKNLRASKREIPARDEDLSRTNYI